MTRKQAKRPALSWTKIDPESWANSESARLLAAGEEDLVPKTLFKIDELLLSTEPVTLLSNFALFCTTSLSNEGVAEFMPVGRQAYAEFAQAMALRHPQDAYQHNTYPGTVLQDLAINIFGAFEAESMRRLKGLQEGTAADQHRLLVRAFARDNTQNTRNWGYGYQNFATALGVFTPVAASMKERWGVVPAEVIDFWTTLTKLIETRISGLFAAISEATREHGHRADAVASACRRLGLPRSIENTILDQHGVSMRRSDDDPVALTNMLLMDRLAFYPFMLSKADLAAARPSGADEASCLQLIDLWSLNFGDLHSSTAEAFFLSNPVWTRPFIRVDRSNWLLPFPGIFFSFWPDLLQPLVPDDAVVQRSFQAGRAEFLEEAVARLFSENFEGAQVERENHWSDPQSGQRFETDVLVRIEDVLFVIEAKAGAVSMSARRGVTVSTVRSRTYSSRRPFKLAAWSAY